jgi:hypothetical protein
VIRTVRTEDGVTLNIGDEAYDYYGFNLGVITGPIDSAGWFDLVTADGRKLYRNGERICSIAYARKRGWIE